MCAWVGTKKAVKLMERETADELLLVEFGETMNDGRFHLRSEVGPAANLLNSGQSIQGGHGVVTYAVIENRLDAIIAESSTSGSFLPLRRHPDNSPWRHTPCEDCLCPCQFMRGRC